MNEAHLLTPDFRRWWRTRIEEAESPLYRLFSAPEMKVALDALEKAEEERNRLREALRMVEENAVSFARSAAEASDPWMVGQIRQFFLDPARTALKKGE